MDVLRGDDVMAASNSSVKKIDGEDENRREVQARVRSTRPTSSKGT